MLSAEDKMDDGTTITLKVEISDEVSAFFMCRHSDTSHQETMSQTLEVTIP